MRIFTQGCREIDVKYVCSAASQCRGNCAAKAGDPRACAWAGETKHACPTGRGGHDDLFDCKLPFTDHEALPARPHSYPRSRHACSVERLSAPAQSRGKAPSHKSPIKQGIDRACEEKL